MFIVIVVVIVDFAVRNRIDRWMCFFSLSLSLFRYLIIVVIYNRNCLSMFRFVRKVAVLIY